MPLEIEVKFLVAEADEMRHRLKRLGAYGQGAVAETNLIFDDAAGTLRRQGHLLRLRRTDHQTLLTLKTPDTSDPQFKVHQELEVCVDDFDTLQQMLLQLGFRVQRCYEKKRETFVWQQTTFCLDHMPFGTFLEIEAPKTSILQAAEALNLNWGDRIVHNYLEIFDRLRRDRKWLFADVTFRNFRGLTPDWTDIIAEFQAGR